MKRATAIQNAQSQLSKELQDIQNNCKHVTQAIRWSPHTKDYRWECVECLARLAYPSTSDLDAYIKGDKT